MTIFIRTCQRALSSRSSRGLRLRTPRAMNDDVKGIAYTTVLVVITAMVAAQFVPATLTNPPVQGSLQAPLPISVTLRRACYDCHSNETRWPWYSRVAPVSWLVVRDVNLGREEINFSEWE